MRLFQYYSDGYPAIRPFHLYGHAHRGRITEPALYIGEFREYENSITLSDGAVIPTNET